MQTVFDILVFVAVLLLLIGFHEFGHLIVGKLCKIPVEKFSIGFGPAIVKWTWGETVYQLSVIPLGGYVKYRGEDFDDPEGFFSFPFGRKSLTTVAGIVANFLLAILIYFIIGVGWGVEAPPAVIEFDEESSFSQAGFVSGDSVVAINGYQVENFYDFARHLSSTDDMEVDVIREGSTSTFVLPASDSFSVQSRLDPVVGLVIGNGPADKAGLKKGDRIISIDGEPVETWSQLHSVIAAADSGQSMEFVWRHEGSEKSADIQTDHIKLTNSQGIGIIVDTPSRPLTFGEAVWLPVRRTGEVTAQIFTLLGRLIVGKESARNLGGVIMIANLSAQSRKWGLDHLLGLLAYLSISLAIINLFPIPAFDGGRILMFLIEKIRGKQFGKKAWTISVNIGFILIILLVGFTIVNDILRIIPGG